MVEEVHLGVSRTLGDIMLYLKLFNMKSYLSNKGALFPAVETDYINDCNISGEKTLLEHSMDKILSDCYMSRCLEEKIPKALQIKLLDRAMVTNRIPSILFHLERYPLEEFVFPVPDHLKLCAVLAQRELPNIILESVRDMPGKMDIMADAFNNVVLNKNVKSNLRILNFGPLPQRLHALKKICTFFSENSSLTFPQQYVVKGSFIFNEPSDYISFISHRDKSSPNLDIIVTGIYCLMIKEDKLMIDVFDGVKDEDLEYLGMEFIDRKLPIFIPSIQRFKNLTTLLLSYVENLEGTTFEDLAQIIYELPELRNFGLKCSTITNRLNDLLMKNCKAKEAHSSCNSAKKMKTEDDPVCCVIHRGKLRNLDVSQCSLVDADLQCLEEYPFCSNLKYISIGFNYKLTSQRLAGCLKHMAPNLVILDIQNFSETSSNVEAIIDILEEFKLLKFLVVGTIKLNKHQFDSLATALLDMPRLVEVRMQPNKFDFENRQSLEEEISNLASSLREKGARLLTKPDVYF